MTYELNERHLPGRDFMKYEESYQDSDTHDGRNPHLRESVSEEKNRDRMPRRNYGFFGSIGSIEE